MCIYMIIKIAENPNFWSFVHMRRCMVIQIVEKKLVGIFTHVHIHVSDPSTSSEMWDPLGGTPTSSAHARNLLRKPAMPAHNAGSAGA